MSFEQTESPPEAPMLEGSALPTLKKQSGIGSSVAYGRSGVLEMGGSLSTSTAENYTETSLSSSIAYFVTDNIQESALGNMSYVDVKDAKVRSVGSLIAEPSLHIPMTNTTFVFAGIGFGARFKKKRRLVLQWLHVLGIKTLSVDQGC